MDRRNFIRIGAGTVAGALIGCGDPVEDTDGGHVGLRDAATPDAGAVDGGAALDAATRDAGTIAPRPDDTTQFLTWDGGSGPNRIYWNKHLKLKWKTPDTGDWIDGNGDANGAVPFATAMVDSVGPVEFDVTSLVERWVSSEVNRGFYLERDIAFGFEFAGRLSGDGPSLEIETDEGTFTPPCLANAQWRAGTFRGYDSRDRFKVGPAIVLFDLSGVRGTVSAASLRLICVDAPRAGTVQVFEADPPVFRVGGGSEPGTPGFAAGYTFDEGIEAHPSVVFASDFSGDLTTMGRYNGRCREGSGYEQIVDPATGSTYLRAVIAAGEVGSNCNLSRNVIRGVEAGGVPDGVETELYARYYVYLESDWGSTVDANKMPGWDLRMGWWNPAQGGYWQVVTGNGGSRGTGLKVRRGDRWEYEGHSVRGHGGEKAGDGNYYDDYFWLGTYLYNLDQDGAFGEDATWTGTVIAKERWTCIEQHLKVNTITGPYDDVGNGQANPDGVLRVWVDGVLSYERTNLRWHRHPEMGIQGFWFNWYHGGTRPPLHDMHYQMNHFVMAREYIGPRGEG